MRSFSLVVFFVYCSVSLGKPWPVLRLLKTLSFFDQLPNPLSLFRGKSSTGVATVMSRSNILFSQSEGVWLEFGALDDVVMGGVSQTSNSPGAGSGVFSGVVSTDNNGGFAGVRTKLFDPPRDISASTGFQLKVAGDGNRYKFIIRDDAQWNGVAWSSSFDTSKGKSVTVKLPIASFKPTRFAKTVVGGPGFNKSNFCGLQFTLSKFEYDGGLNQAFTAGAFNLELQEISLY